ncbi:hypothetical protein B0T17DRAFT_524880 [Bombardia bombarda]|uniref:Uncharacterized protein n=1 Tax=Bombardia bombarda TaxID=252184 RepID=A0AA40C9I0_9PEZI|nr:hypothetical protein B0T17DRAFT_524880 [Bombardia bombarda]
MAARQVTRSSQPLLYLYPRNIAQSLVRARQLHRPQLTPAPSSIAAISTRQLHHSPPVRSYKDDQDRTSLKPHTCEHTKSADDSEIAQLKDAFNPKVTNPWEVAASATEEGNGLGSKLEASGINQEFSKPLGDKDHGELPDHDKDTMQKRKKSAWAAMSKHGHISKVTQC